MMGKKLGFAAAVLATLMLAACGAAQQQQGGMTSLSVQLNWFPEPEHGEFYGGVVGGAYKAAGLNVTPVSGGPQISSTQLVASGKADFGVTDADSIALARAQGIPIVAVMADFQTNPQILLYHPDSGINKIQDLNGRTVYVSPGIPFWSYFQKKYDLKPKQTVAYQGSLAAFVADKNAVNQGYVTSEPYTLEHEQHTPVKWFLNADLGYNPYVVAFTSEKTVKERPDMVKKFVQATIKGWSYYFQHSTEVNTAIHKADREMSTDQMAYSAGVMKPLVDGKGNTPGVMTGDRWNTIVDQLASIGALKQGSVKASDCFAPQFAKAS